MGDESTKMSDEKLSDIYQRRFYDNKQQKSAINREHAWICLFEKVFRNFIKPEMTVLDLGSGPGHFINQVIAQKCIAIDADATNEKYIRKDIEFLNVKAQNLDFLPENSVDLIFSSNLFEHLSSSDDLFKVLQGAHRVMKKGNSKMIVLMPNIRFAKWDFFDFIDHKLPLNEISLKEALEISNFEVLSSHRKFFPYSADRSLINWPIFVFKAYLTLPLRCVRLQNKCFLLLNQSINLIRGV